MLVIIRDKKSAFDVFCCFISGIFVFFCCFFSLSFFHFSFFFFFGLTTYNRHGHNLVLLKFTIKQLESKFILSGI